MSDPYTTLGISRNASPEEIRRAYRALALAHHPDRGGDPVVFQAVTESHDLLSDPARKARFDTTGQTDELRPQHPQAPLLAVLVPCMAHAIQEMLQQGHKATNGNLVNFMKRVLEREKGERNKQRDGLEKGRAAFQVVAERVHDPDGEDALLVSVARHHLSQIDAQIERLVSDENMIGKALEYLAKCRYDFDAMGTFRWGGVTTSTAKFWGTT